MSVVESRNFDGDLHRFRWAKPFRTFELLLTNGLSYQITDPDQIAFGGNKVVVAKPQTGIQILRMHQIAQIRESA